MRWAKVLKVGKTRFAKRNRCFLHHKIHKGKAKPWKPNSLYKEHQRTLLLSCHAFGDLVMQFHDGHRSNLVTQAHDPLNELGSLDDTCDSGIPPRVCGKDMTPTWFNFGSSFRTHDS